MRDNAYIKLHCGIIEWEKWRNKDFKRFIVINMFLVDS